VQFGAELYVAPLAYFMRVNQKNCIFSYSMRCVVLKLQNLWQIPKETMELSYGVAYHLKLNSRKITADTICVMRSRGLGSITSQGEQK